MGTNSASETDSPDTDARIGTKHRLSTGRTIPRRLSLVFNGECESTGDDLDGFIADVTTIVQSWSERATGYADIETLVCSLPINHLTFAAHDTSAPYSGPYPMAILIRAFLIKEINGWDETALHDYLQAHPSLRRGLGFETLPNQSTFWRAWNHRCSQELRDAVQECADAIVRAVRAPSSGGL